MANSAIVCSKEPSSSVESWLRDHLGRLVGTDILGRPEDVDLRSLGLDSLEVQRLVGDLETFLNRQLDLQAFKRIATLQDLLDWLDTRESDEPEPAVEDL